MMIYDDFEDLRFRVLTPQQFDNRLAWDIYRLPSANMFIDYDSNDIPTCKPFNESLKRGEYRFLPVYVDPSLSIFHLYYRDDVLIGQGEVIDAFRDYVEENIQWFNSVKFNDFREPLEPPIDFSYYDDLP